MTAFAAGPDRRVLWPSVTTTLFPYLPRERRTPFRLALAAVAVALAVCAVLR